MIVEVVKKGGMKESFNTVKIKRSIEKAAIDAGYALDEIESSTNQIINEIADEAEKNGEIDTETIKIRIFNKLEITESSIVESWKKFDTKYKS